MRRTVTLSGIALLFALVLPAAAAFAAVDLVKATPSVDTKEVGQTETIVATALSSGAPTSGQRMAFKITSGPNTGLAIPFCTTGSSGQCSSSYTGTTAGASPDVIQVWNDLDASGTQNGAEAEVAPASRPAITWVAAGQGTKKVRIDMEGCDGSTGPAPINESTWNGAAMTTQTGSTVAKEVCAARFGPATGGPPPTSEPLTPGPVTFTITSGPGHFTDSTGTQNLGSTVTVDVGAGSRNHAWVQSTATGTTAVQASAEGVNASGTLPWNAAPARIIDVTTGTPTRAPGQSPEFTAHVTDRYGNDVGGVTVVFTEAGPGSFAGGTSSASVVTGPTGLATVILFSTASDTGSNTVTGSLNAGTSECAMLAGNPAGSPAGVCSDSATVTFAAAASDLTIGIDPVVGVWGTTFTVSGVLSGSGTPAPGRTIDITKRSPGETAFTPAGSVTTDASGRYSFAQMPNRITEYRARFAGDSSFNAVESGVVQASVRYGVPINQSTARPLVGSAVTFTGRVLPENPGAPVYLQQLSGGVWRTVRSSHLGSTSGFRFTFTKTSPGFLLFRAVTPSSALRSWNASKNVGATWVTR